MLAEIRVVNLGVIADLTLVLQPGMTALTGETGAGKTLVVEAIELLLGARADGVILGTLADEARVEGRFVTAEGESVVARVLPRGGRSRAYVDGRMATVGELAELARDRVDLYSQHAHQTLLEPRAAREALDRFGDIDASPLAAARARVAEAEAALVRLGGDAREREREMDMLRFQVAELASAAIADADEDERLAAEEEVLSAAAALRSAADAAYEHLAADGGVEDALGRAASVMAGLNPLAGHHRRLSALTAEVADAARDLRSAGEAIVDDPGRAEEVRSRLHLLKLLCRKYGERLADVIVYQAATSARLAELEDREVRAAMAEAARKEAEANLAGEKERVLRARQAVAPGLAAAIEGRLRVLALPRADFEVSVSGDEGARVEFLLSANPGQPSLPLAKVASGGELARAMLATRLVLTEAPPTLIFDEVDAGIGGEAASAVGAALADLAAGGARQVLVVTHLAQVAAFADHHVVVTKTQTDGGTRATARPAEGEDRLGELSRMMSGRPDSRTARAHAGELLAGARSRAAVV
ncbi:MAG: DNA repair protein RecN [Acidimicrobiales bacterium]